MPSRLNAEWHRQHVLGSHAPLEARVAWHLEHARHCACREVPASMLAEFERRGIALPERPDAGRQG